MQKSKNNKNKKQNDKWGQIKLGGFRAEFPQPRIPRLLGAARNLGSDLSVYPMVKLDLPIGQTKFSVAAGALASYLSVNYSLIANWTNIASVFRSYAIVGFNFEVRVNNVVNPAGVVCLWIDEEAGSVGTSAEALRRPRLDVLLTQQTVPGSYLLKWTPRDILDLDYTASGTSFSPCYVKVYTDVANFGTTASTTGDVIITGSLAMEFRGYN